MPENSYKKIAQLYKKYQNWKREFASSMKGKAFNLVFNLFLSILAVVPLLMRICREIPFSYEVNDDAVVAQILDGSYTGTPEAHAIFVRYPLSWVMQFFYKKNPVITWGDWCLDNVNWYVGVIVVLEVVALAAVLFRMLNYFTYNRLLICGFFDVGFVMLWLPCFSDMTFSTAAAFFGCMGLLFFAFERKEEAWRPWNLLILGMLLSTSWCLRKQCLYMVLPFLVIEIILKYHIDFFRSAKPWIVCGFCGALFAGIIMLNGKMYGSQEWKQYFIYNHARAYLQDYVGFPDYEEEKEFYKSIGVNEAGRNAMAGYTYCMVDNFDTDWVEKTYLHVKNTEKEIPLKEEIEHAKKKALKYLWDKQGTNDKLKNCSFYFWMVLVPLFPVSVVFCWKKGIGSHISNLIAIWTMAVFLAAEWIYLAMNGRFPQRVEEAIRLLMFSIGFLLVCKLLQQWKDASFTRVPVWMQVVLLCLVFRLGMMQQQIKEMKGVQEYNLTYAAEKEEVLNYCGNHPDNYYVLDTRSFSKMSRPSDNLHQGNWFMSGSWAAYTPIYDEKLKINGINSLGSEFLTRKNVYIITKGKKNLAASMGIDDKEKVESEIIEEIMTTNNSFFEVYKIKKIIH